MPVLSQRFAGNHAFLAGALLALGGCQTATKVPPPVINAVPISAPLKADEWNSVANEPDKDRLKRLDQAWKEALGEARKSNPADVRREGALLRADGALEQPDPTPGSYNCRLIELGRGVGKTRGPAFTAYKPFFCYVEIDGGQLTFTKQTGSQRPSGRLWEDDNALRMIFLGSMAQGAADKTLPYGENAKRDLVGTFERIGPFRWRLVLPWPQKAGAKLDVYELTPVADQPE